MKLIIKGDTEAALKAAREHGVLVTIECERRYGPYHLETHATASSKSYPKVQGWFQEDLNALPPLKSGALLLYID